jgi:hypothetical protein
VLLGIFIGCGGTFAVTGDDFINAGKNGSRAVIKTLEIVSKHVDNETLNSIKKEVTTEVFASLTEGHPEMEL